MEKPPVSRNASPRAIIMMARVVMKGAHLEPRHDQPAHAAHHAARQRAGQEPQQHHPRRGLRAAELLHDQRRDHGGQGDQAADGQVDAARDNHHRHADGNHGDHDNAVHNGQQVRRV